MLNAGSQVGDFKNFLLLLDLQHHVRGHGVDQASGLVDAVQRGQHFGRDLLAQLHVLLELAQQAAGEYFSFALRRFAFTDQQHFSPRMALDLNKAFDGAALLTLHQHLDGAIWQLEQLQHAGDCTDAIQTFFARIIVSRIFLGDQQDLFVAGHGRLQSLNGLFPTDKQRDHHVWINHNIAQRQERQFDGCLHDLGSTAAMRP